MLESLFDVILQMSFYGMIAGAFAALLCILLRYLPCSRRVGFLLWAVAALRLVCPLTVPIPQHTGADMTLIAADEVASDKGFNMSSASKDGDSGGSTGAQMQPVNPAEKNGSIHSAKNSAAGADGEGGSRMPDFLQQIYFAFTEVSGKLWSVLPKSYVAILWFAGVLVFWGFGIWDAYRLHKRLRFAMKIADGVYEVDTIRSSCVAGIRRPRIYLMSGLNERQKECILCHEQEHIRHRDYIWKPLAYVILGLHWFNIPLWIFYEMFQNEMERYCDERVVARFGAEKKEDYCEVLLQMAVRRSQFPLSPLAFGENRRKNDMKDRVGQILNQKKHSRMMQAEMLVLSLGIGTLLLSGGKVLGAQKETEIETPVLQNTASLEKESEEEAIEAGYFYKVTEYPLEELAKTLYELRNPYVGDAPANGALLETLRMYLPDTGITQEIEAQEKPYRLILNMEEGPDVEDEISMHQYGNLEKAAAVFLALIGNVDEVVFSYPTEDEEKNPIQMNENYDAEWMAECYDGLVVKDYAQSEEKILELLQALEWPLYFDEAGNALTGEMIAEDGGTMHILVDGNSLSVVGGANGPTSIFIAGKIDGTEEDAVQGAEDSTEEDAVQGAEYSTEKDAVQGAEYSTEEDAM